MISTTAKLSGYYFSLGVNLQKLRFWKYKLISPNYLNKNKRCGELVVWKLKNILLVA
jgi:hypothetical protein